MGGYKALQLPAAYVTYSILVLLFFSTSSPDYVQSADAASSNPPKLLLVSFDGFGWNFLNKVPKTELPNFEAFMKEGVHVRWVENIFPTVTRPNHMSLISGLYPESHGIVENDFYDPKLNAVMPGAGMINDSRWVDMGAEPIWVTNSVAGEGRLSGSILWPCSDAKIKGRFPDKMLSGEWNVTENMTSPLERIETAFEWLTLENEPLNFVAVYFNNPDEISHNYGPDSLNVYNSIISRDKIVENIMTKIKDTKLEGTLNVIITADHGQIPVYPDQVINLDLLIDPAWYSIHHNMENWRPVVMLWPNEGFFDQVINGLKHINLHVGIRTNSEDLLELHFSTHYRIAPIVIWAEAGWMITTNASEVKNGTGQHGWDPRYSPHMYPFFMAKGPAFKKGLHYAKPFNIVDIYPLMCHILGITPASNNGSLSKTAHILASVRTVTSENSTSYTGVAIGILILILAVVIIVVIIIRYQRNNQNITSSYKRSYTKADSDDLMTDATVVLSASDDDLDCLRSDLNLPQKQQESDPTSSFRRRLNPQPFPKE